MTKGRVLLFEDTREMRESIYKTLTHFGYEVIACENGDHALDAYNTEHPDVVITDIFLPVKDGIEITQEIRNTDPNARIIAMSGGKAGFPQTIDAATQTAATFGANAAIAKPFRNSELLATIEAVMKN